MEEENKNYRILAQSLEEFKWLETGYKELMENFAITGTDLVLVKKGFYFQGEKKRIHIAPLIESNEIKSVSKYGSNLEWNLIGSTREEWEIQGKDCDYMICAKIFYSLL